MFPLLNLWFRPPIDTVSENMPGVSATLSGNRWHSWFEKSLIKTLGTKVWAGWPETIRVSIVSRLVPASTVISLKGWGEWVVGSTGVRDSCLLGNETHVWRTDCRACREGAREINTLTSLLPPVSFWCSPLAQSNQKPEDKRTHWRPYRSGP